MDGHLGRTPDLVGLLVHLGDVGLLVHLGESPSATRQVVVVARDVEGAVGGPVTVRDRPSVQSVSLAVQLLVAVRA
ncbi:MAG: hypothetical protein JWN08_863, partial [Frankiales bacterium]|nr:hypothetical protein [Frankiales bacterium]